MSDVVNVTSKDVVETFGTASYFLPDGSPSTMVDDLKTLLSAFQESNIQVVTQRIDRFVDLSGSGAAGDTPFVSQAAALTFIDSDSLPYTCYVLAPLDGTFLTDGTVDDTQTWVADLIAFLLANGTSAGGATLTSYSTGHFVELQPGSLDVNGAASMARTSNIVTEFSAQDGADIKVG